MERWLPPHNMTGDMLHFDFREGGFYRMRLSYAEPRRRSPVVFERIDRTRDRTTIIRRAAKATAVLIDTIRMLGRSCFRIGFPRGV